MEVDCFYIQRRSDKKIFLLIKVQVKLLIYRDFYNFEIFFRWFIVDEIRWEFLIHGSTVSKSRGFSQEKYRLVTFRHRRQAVCKLHGTLFSFNSRPRNVAPESHTSFVVSSEHNSFSLMKFLLN